jgi:hypothetical protein
MTEGSCAMNQNDLLVRLFYFSSKSVYNLLFETTFLRFIGYNTPTEFDDKHMLPA